MKGVEESVSLLYNTHMKVIKNENEWNVADQTSKQQIPRKQKFNEKSRKKGWSWNKDWRKKVKNHLMNTDDRNIKPKTKRNEVGKTKI